MITAATAVSASDYEVKKGDSLWKIAEENETTVEILMEINELDSTLIHPKQKLKLEEPEEEVYIVQKGDTLTHISNAHDDGVTVEKLKEWNNLSSDLILIGQGLYIDQTQDEISKESKSMENIEDEEVYVVQKGDTLTEISDAHGTDVTVNELKEWNDLTSDLIITGQRLYIDGAQAEITEKSRSSGGEAAVTEPEQKETNEDQVEDIEEGPDEEEGESEVETVAKTEENQASEVTGRTFAVEATAYTANCAGCSGITATGINLNNDRNAKVIAVDPNVIPLGTEVYVEGYGYAVAGDTGGAIKGHKIDIHVPTKAEAYSWGRRTVNITILE
jgi:3D (Asp-Asp-Asp) domain-containing protein